MIKTATVKTASKPTAKATGKVPGKTISRSLPPKGKPAVRKKPGLTGAVIALAAFMAAIVIWQWNRSPATVPAPPAGIQAGTSAATAPAGGEAPIPAAAGTAQTASGGAETGPVIAAIRITPAQPVTTDAIVAVAFLADGDATGITFTYQWKRNDRIIPDATTNVLKDPSLKRGDRIAVVVKANRNGAAGPPVESQVVVNNPPPPLEMKVLTPRVLLGKPFEIQLTTGRTAGEGEKDVFSLIPPLVEGMTIDGHTGKITWTPVRVYTGKLLFGATVTDADGNRTTRVFELDLGTTPGTAAEERQ